MSTCLQPRTASIAADPVSPLVAPTIMTCSSRSASTWSKSRPTSCSATSLNASVGPWNSSSSHCRVVDLDERHDRRVAERRVRVAHIRSNTARSISPPTNGAHHGRGDVGVVARAASVGQRGPLGGHVQPTVVGEPGEQHIGEPELGRRAARRHVPHVSRRSRAAARRCDARRRARAARARSPAHRPRAPRG